MYQKRSPVDFSTYFLYDGVHLFCNSDSVEPAVKFRLALVFNNFTSRWTYNRQGIYPGNSVRVISLRLTQ